MLLTVNAFSGLRSGHFVVADMLRDFEIDLISPYQLHSSLKNHFRNPSSQHTSLSVRAADSRLIPFTRSVLVFRQFLPPTLLHYHPNFYKAYLAEVRIDLIKFGLHHLLAPTTYFPHLSL